MANAQIYQAEMGVNSNLDIGDKEHWLTIDIIAETSPINKFLHISKSNQEFFILLTNIH